MHLQRLRALAVLTLSVALSAGCGAPQATPPTGEFICNATESGMLVGTGWFTIKSDGTIVDNVSQSTGTWTYDANASEFQFSPNLDVAKAVYDASRQTLVFTLRTGAHRDHVVGSDFACWPKT